MPELKVIFQLRGLPPLPEGVQITGFGLQKTASGDTQIDEPTQVTQVVATESECP